MTYKIGDHIRFDIGSFSGNTREVSGIILKEYGSSWLVNVIDTNDIENNVFNTMKESYVICHGLDPKYIGCLEIDVHNDKIIDLVQKKTNVCKECQSRRTV